jgi:hypothetical protein
VVIEYFFQKQKRILASLFILSFDRNVVKTAVCSDCEKPRLLHAGKKMSPQDSSNLTKLLDRWQYSCGATLEDLKTHGMLK